MWISGRLAYSAAMSRPASAIILLAATSCSNIASATSYGPAAMHFAAHCEYAVLPNFEKPLKSYAVRAGMVYGTGSPDASGTPTLATLTDSNARIELRFASPKPNDVVADQYALGKPTKQDDVAFGRVTQLFRFCR